MRSAGSFRAGLRRDGGQASVELVALAPAVLAAVLAVSQLLAAGAAQELADHAAEAGAIAMLQRADPAAAARGAIPGWSRGRVDVRVQDRHVRVRVRPRSFLPALAELLEATGDAHAGPSS